MNQNFIKVDPSTLDSKFLNIPVIKNNSSNLAISKGVKFETATSYFLWIMLAVGAVVGAVFFLPAFFALLGKLAAIAVCGVAGLLVLFNLEIFTDIFKSIGKGIKKFFINSDPFYYIAKGIAKHETALNFFRTSKKQLLGVSNSLQTSARDNEQEAKVLFKNLNDKQLFITNLKKKLEADNSLQVPFQRAVNEYSNLKIKYDQKVSLAERYGLKALTYKKAYDRFCLLEPTLENKVEELKLSADMLREEYKAVEIMKSATETAKTALGFTQDADFEMASDIIKGTIDLNTAIVTDNLSSLSQYTEQYVMNNEDALTKFDQISTNLEKTFSLNVAKYTDSSYKVSKAESDLEPLSNIFN